MTKRIVSFLLTIAMLVSVFPVQAFAVQQEEVESAQISVEETPPEEVTIPQEETIPAVAESAFPEESVPEETVLEEAAAEMVAGEEADTSVASGTCGKNLTWVLDSDGILTVSGYGAMDDIDTWYYYGNQITAVNLPEGLTSISQEAFYGCTYLSSIEIPASVSSIAENAFLYCGGLRKMTFSGPAPTIALSAFSGSTFTVHYPGDDATWSEDVRKDYGGNITWKPYCKNAHTVEIEAAAVAPTCTETGLTEKSRCSVCKTLISAQTVIPAKGHTRVIDEAVDPTCTETGLTEGDHCSVCSVVFSAQIVVPAKGHTPAVDAAVEQTCKEPGLTEGSHCSVCGEILVEQQEIPVHFPESVPGVPSSCTEDGLTEGSHCLVCGEVLVPQQIIPAAHVPVTDEAKEPSCTETGLTGGSHCEVCGAILEEQEEVPTLPHQFSDGVCQDCGEPAILWEVSADGTLTITGTGDIADFYSAEVTPWYDQREQITSVHIAHGVTAIGDRSFAELSNLKQVSIPDTVRTIGDSAFRRCYSLEEVILGKNVTTIGISAFEHCEKLAAITYPASANVKSDAFCNTPMLSQINLAAGAMPDFTSESCKKLPWFESGAEKITVTMLDGVTHIGDYAFSGITGKVKVEFPASLLSIGDHAFYQAELPYQLKLPGKLQSIGDYAFSDSYNVFIMTLPDSVTELGTGVFYENVTLTYLEFPKGLNEIPAKTCEGCISLKKVFLPEFDRATENLFIGASAFACCISLESIRFPNVYVDIERDAFMLTGLKTLSLPAECRVHNYAFSYNVYLTRIDMFEDDVDLHMYAFLGCENLQTLNIDGYSAMQTGRIYVAEAAFMDCIRLTQVYYHRGSEYWDVKDNFDGGVEISNYAGENDYLMRATKYYNRALGSASEISVYDISWTLTDSAPLEEQRIYPVNMNNAESITLAIFNHQGDGVKQFTYTPTMSVPDAVTFEDVSDAGLPGRLKMNFHKPCNLELVIGYTYYDGRTFTKTLMFEIQKPVVSVSISLKEDCIPLNDTVQASASVYPSDAANTNVSWRIINGTGSARIDQQGNIYGTKEGIVTLRATAADGSGVYGEKTVKVSRRYVTGIHITGDVQGYAALNLPLQLKAEVLPSNAENKAVRWSVENGTGEAEIDQTGLLTGIKAGTVTVRASACDGSDIVEFKTINIQPYCVTLQGDDRVQEGSSITLTSSLFPANLTNTSVCLELVNPDDSRYVSIQNSTLSVLAISEMRTVTVQARSADGLAVPAVHSVVLIPDTERILLWEQNTEVTGKTLYFDLNNPEMTEITIHTGALPLGANESVNWTCSDKTNKYAQYQSDANSFRITNTTGQPGTVTLTAVSQENRRVKAQVKIQFVKLAQQIEILDPPGQLRGGAKLALKTNVAKAVGLTDRKVIWSLSDDSEPFATISSSGSLTTRTVSEPVTITVNASLAANPKVKTQISITLSPAAKEPRIYADGVLTTKGQTVYVPMTSPVVKLSADILPANAAQQGTWKLSSSRYAALTEYDGYVQVNMLAAGKTVTVTFTASDGSKKATSVKIQSIIPVKTIQLSTPKGQTELRSGKSLQVSAVTAASQDGLLPTVRKFVWTVSDPTAATVSSTGKVKALTVYRNTPVTVTATATDGSDICQSIDLTIKPAKDKTLVLCSGSENITGTTRIIGVDFDSESTIPTEELTVWVYDSLEDTMTKVDASVKLSGKSVQLYNGNVSAKAYGNSTITATYEKLTAKVTYKVLRFVSGIHISSKNGVDWILAGKKLSLKASVTNANATVKKLQWSVSDPTAASVSSSGTVTAKKVSVRTVVTVTAAATDGSGVRQSFAVTIYPAASGVLIKDAASGRVMNNRTITVSLADLSGMELTALVSPQGQDGAMNRVVFSCSGSAAKVTPDGTVTFKKKGTVTIKATAADGSKVSASFKIKIV